MLTAALALFDGAAPHVQDLACQFLPRLPRLPLCSQNLRTSHPSPYSRVLRLDVAADCPWISTDSETHRNALVFDIDHEDGIDLVGALPARIRPWLVIDPWSGRSHAILFLASPVLVSEGSRPKARRLAEVAQAMMAEALRATPLRHRALVKNPLGRVRALLGQHLRRTPKPAMPALWDAWQASGSPLIWHTIPGAGPVELRDVIAALADDHGDRDDDDGDEAGVEPRRTQRSLTRRRPEPSALGRNCCLFDALRYWAYDRAECDGGLILAEAVCINARFATALPASEVAATARSITKYMHTRFRPRHGPGTGRGRDRQAAAALPPEARKAYAGKQTAAARTAKTDAQISAAVELLQMEGARFTQAAIAARAGVGIATVKRRWASLHAAIGRVSFAVVSGSAPASAPLPAVQTSDSPPVQRQKAARQDFGAAGGNIRALAGAAVKMPGTFGRSPVTRLRTLGTGRAAPRWPRSPWPARQKPIQRQVAIIGLHSRPIGTPAATGPPYRAPSASPGGRVRLAGDEDGLLAVEVGFLDQVTGHHPPHGVAPPELVQFRLPAGDDLANGARARKAQAGSQVQVQDAELTADHGRIQLFDRPGRRPAPDVGGSTRPASPRFGARTIHPDFNIKRPETAPSS
jgi:hypothetical protein